MLATLGGEVKIDPRARLSSLTVSKRQMVDIAKAVSYNCDIIALDEPRVFRFAALRMARSRR